MQGYLSGLADICSTLAPTTRKYDQLFHTHLFGHPLIFRARSPHHCESWGLSAPGGSMTIWKIMGEKMSKLLVTKDKVTRFSKELFNVVMIDDDGDLVIPYESTQVFIRVFEREVAPENEDFWNDNQISRTVVNLWAPVVVDVKPSNDLYKWVATEGQDFIYGHCKILDYSDQGNLQVLYEVTIAGDTIDPGELKQALLAVATTTDDLDDVLKGKFGGKRYEDV
jgi:hypothetical protein